MQFGEKKYIFPTARVQCNFFTLSLMQFSNVFQFENCLETVAPLVTDYSKAC